MESRRIFTLVSLLAIVAVGTMATFWWSSGGESGKFVFDHPALEHPDIAGRQVVARMELLDPVPAFNFKLTDTDFTTTQLEDFKGKLVLVGFMYTNCPDVCGLLTQHFKYIQREFEDELEKDLVLVLITTDPEGDTPDRARAYTEGFEGKWHFLTGSEDELAEVWDEYKVFVEAKKSVNVVYHSYMVALIDGDAQIRYRYIGLVDPQKVIVNDINILLKEKEA